MHRHGTGKHQRNNEVRRSDSLQPSRRLQSIHSALMKPLIYVAGKFTGTTIQAEHQNTERARRFAQKLYKQGYMCLVPHLMFGIRSTEESTYLRVSYEDIMAKCLKLINACEAVYMTFGWDESRGSVIERAYAIERNIPVIYNLEEAARFLSQWKQRHD